MTVITETLTSVQDSILETIDTVQSPVVDAVRTVVEKVEERLPEDRPTIPAFEQIDLTELVEANYAFAKKLVDRQHEFAKAIVDAVAPLFPASAKPAPKTTKKATAAAA